MGLYRKKNNTEISQIAGSVDYSEINELKQNLNNVKKWKKVGSTVGTSLISLPTEFNEIMIDSTVNAGTILSCSIVIAKESLKTTSKRYFGGFSVSSTNNYCQYDVTLNSVILYGFVITNQDYSSTTETIVYYR